MSAASQPDQQHLSRPHSHRWARLCNATLCVAALLTPAAASAETHTIDADAAPGPAELRVELPIEHARFRDGELKIDSLIERHTYLEPDDYLLRAVELDATSSRGSVRLKVGRYLTPEIDLPQERIEGATLRVEAPYKSHRDWRLLVNDRVRFFALTAVLEPRNPTVAYAPGQPGDVRVDRTRRYSTDPYFAINPYSTRQRFGHTNRRWGQRYEEQYRRANRWYWLNDRNRYTDRVLIGPIVNRPYYDRFGRYRGRPETPDARRHPRPIGRDKDEPRARPPDNPRGVPEPVMQTPAPVPARPRQRLSAPFERPAYRSDRTPGRETSRSTNNRSTERGNSTSGRSFGSRERPQREDR